MIRLIALDLDDTLLRQDKTISLENQKAIALAKSQGIKIVIASGRPLFRINPILESLDLMEDENYIIALNGGLIATTHQKILYQKQLMPQDIQCIMRELLDRHLSFMMYQDDQIYTNQLDATLRQLPIFQGVMLKEQSIAYLQHVGYASKIIIVDTKVQLDSHQPKLVEALSSYTVVRTTPYFLEILPNHVNKGTALEFLATHLHILPQEMMAIGDAENDISMLKRVGIGVAMANATEEVKQAARFITLSCEEDGVAYAIQNISLKR
ncbi:MAG: Cof-type HAD-IIB family hydrolase [Prevotella sp.]|nr:Cof-type HAD-IIB family hydrolase [Staphylococcus sp.]MCM1350315.1 Cof-type HAD-IIB family hydrolase [Prevotella sp.]